MSSKADLGHICARMKQGDRAAFGLFYSACRERLLTLCLHYVANEAVADDLLHDAFILMFSRIGELKDPSKAEAWATTVTRNVCLLYLRDRKRYATVGLAEAESILTSVANEPALVSYDEIMQFVDQLPEGYARVFRLSVLEGMSHQEIADLLNIDPHTSSSQLFRAKQALRRLLRPMLLLLLSVLLSLDIWLWKKPTENVATADRPRQTKPLQQESSQQQKAAHGRILTCLSPKHMKATEHQQASSCLHEPTQPPDIIAQNRQAQHPDSIAQNQPTGEETAPNYHTPAEQYHPAGQQSTTQRKNADRWMLALACSAPGYTNGSPLPSTDYSTNSTVSDTITHHHMPLILSLSLHYRLDSHWQAGTGLQYTRLITEQHIGNTYASLLHKQKVSYLGIPLSFSYHYPLSNRLSVSATASATLHLPLHSTVSSHYVLSGNTSTESSTERLNPGTQLSVGMGVGAEYRLWPHVVLFVEPTLHHYFGSSGGVETWNTAHPLVFSLPAGLRFTW